MSDETTEYCPIDLLSQTQARVYLLDNLYLESLCTWVLDNPEQSEYVQDKLRGNIEALSVEGYDILWNRLGGMPGWKNLVWTGLGLSANPVELCGMLLRKTTGVFAIQEMYLFLHKKLAQRSGVAATKFSQEAAPNASSWAIGGIWLGSHLLMEAILENEGKHFLVDGKYSWWEAGAKALQGTMERGGTLIESGILDPQALTYVNLLERWDVGAENDPDEVGIVFARASEISPGYVPVLWAWMSAGGNWQGAWDQCGQTGRKLMERHPCVVRSKLMSLCQTRLSEANQHYDREM